VSRKVTASLPVDYINTTGEKQKRMFQKIKDGYHNLRRHKIMVLLILILGYGCYAMFVRNYEFQQPIISKRAESYTKVWNERAELLQDKTTLKEAIEACRSAVNPDL